MTQDPIKKSLLFVDDEQNVLQALRRMLRSERNEWDMEFVGSGDEALAIMKERPFDIIVSDIRMPGMDGVQLLNKVKGLYPSTVRFILSGHADKGMIIRSVGPTHQFLSKPCDSETLKSAVSRAVKLRELFQGEKIIGLVKDTSLPTLPELYQRLYEVLNSPDSSMGDVAEIVSSDVAMTARILQLVNSAFFGIVRHIENITQAVTLLGLETISSIVLTEGVFDKFEEKDVREFKIRELYHHSVVVGAYSARIIKKKLDDHKIAEEAMLAGMTHDMGKLAMVNSKNEAWREVYRRHKSEHIPLYQVEQETLGITHAELGAYLLGLWGLSDNIVEATAFHHEPSRCINQSFGILTAVHLADVFQHRSTPADKGSGMSEPDSEYVTRLGLDDQVQELEELCKDEDD